MYTGHFQQDQNCETLLSLLQLSHEWEMSSKSTSRSNVCCSRPSPLEHSKSSMISHLDHATHHCSTFCDYGEEVRATLLLEREEFQRENVFALKEMIDWGT